MHLTTLTSSQLWDRAEYLYVSPHIHPFLVKNGTARYITKGQLEALLMLKELDRKNQAANAKNLRLMGVAV